MTRVLDVALVAAREQGRAELVAELRVRVDARIVEVKAEGQRAAAMHSEHGWGKATGGEAELCRVLDWLDEVSS